MNTKAIADAIAARFAGITATLGSNTESLTSAPTASLPNTITTGPVILVDHPTGVLDVIVSRRRKDQLEFPVRLLRDPIDVPTRSDWLYAWYDAMRDQVGMQMSLGLAYVAWAQPISMDAGIDGFAYADRTFDFVELVVRVQLDEVVTTLAP